MLHLFQRFKRWLINTIQGFYLIDINMKVEESICHRDGNRLPKKQVQDQIYAQNNTLHIYVVFLSSLSFVPRKK